MVIATRPVQAQVILLLFAALLAVGGCSVLPGGDDEPPPAVFLLQPSTQGDAMTQDNPGCAVLQVRPVSPAPGFLTDRMLYSRSADQVEFFSQSRWLDVPSRMVDAYVVDRLSRAGFATVVPASAPVDSRYRMELSSFRLLQQFNGDSSTVVLGLDAALFDTDERRQLAQRDLVVREPAGGDARSGVAAASTALDMLLDDLTRFAGDALLEAAPPCD